MIPKNITCFHLSPKDLFKTHPFSPLTFSHRRLRLCFSLLRLCLSVFFLSSPQKKKKKHSFAIQEEAELPSSL
ncbi:hypothetical protein L2E82_49151 [Cichorium intybus]|uniref:Uncharacterized protein n=1 Tax=Cichorium intybus TaxID=13427 RepID=A0ACB8Z049_CICIN|nr:hypothetical protein L2E82_49151 [Cichorium intybus]